ncbi:hypothetical protein B0H13DRAFT_1627417 [Mycena leptocephala]|nr:hypothetical protein B0H13DRAFT_1627417 [Mycena leptocephala]
MFVPRTLSAIADARDALARLSLVFRAPLREGAPFVVDPEQEAAVWAKGAGREWEEKLKGKKEKEGGGKEKQNENEEEHPPAEQPLFALHDIALSIPRGTLAAVVGRVGSGKSILLQGHIGGCAPPTWAWAGQVGIGGSVAYCAGSRMRLRDNVLFGQLFEEDRYWGVIEDSCLLPDLQLLADGDLTEVRCRTLLAGGQKQRVNIARALYYGATLSFSTNRFPLVCLPHI